MNNNEIGNNFNEKDIQDISDISSNSGSVSSNEVQNESNNVAVAGFILSLIGLHIVGLILSIVGLKKSKEKNNKGKGLSIAGIVISSVGIIFITIIIAVLLISIKDSVYDAKSSSVIDTYKMIKKSAEQNIILSSLGDTNITCTKDNCYENYNYNKEYYDVMITDKGTYYELEIDAIGDFSNVNLNDRCNDLEATCMGNTIIGKINKE